MSSRFCLYSVTLTLFIFLMLHTATVRACDVDDDCGWRATCDNATNTCVCAKNYTLHTNSRDCVNNTCKDTPDCLECSDEALCHRCVNFLEETARNCIATCTGEAKIVYSGQVQGSICVVAESKEDENMDLIIGIVAGVASGVLICLIVGIVVCVYLRRTRRNVNLKQTQYTAGNMQIGNIKKVPIYDNKGFEPDITLVHNLVDHDVYLAELEKLKPHAQTLLTILNELRHKLRNMDKVDPRISTYKGIIHQLCRVLVLIHKKDPGASIPSDALGLMEWAHQMIDDRQMCASQSEDSSVTPVTRISYVEVPEKQQYSAYATPHVHKKENSYASLKKRTSQSQLSPASYYSSVPVPVGMTKSSDPSNNIHISVSQNNTMKRKADYDIPWDLKARQDSIASLNCSGSDLTLGYFANGRYYDPSPRQQVQKPREKEVYAPASSYSDRSNPVFSTFGGAVGIAHTPPSLSSDSSTVCHEDQEDQIEDGEGLPFDFTQATEPVEV